MHEEPGRSRADFVADVADGLKKINFTVHGVIACMLVFADDAGLNS